MASRADTKLRRERWHNAMQRYQKERNRNQLASPGPQEFIVVLDHLKAGFNVPKIFRSAEAFGAHEVHLINIDPFDPAPAKGAFRKVPARFHDSFSHCYEELSSRDYQLFAMQGHCEQHSGEFSMPKKSAFIMGNEGLGLCFDPQQYPDIGCLAIPLIGNMESLNVSVAASIIMYEYNRQHPMGAD
jgi:tRNA G18 (ribose-2'-O)-methylase SpoU